MKHNLGICFVSSYRPRECGIATFTSSIINALPKEVAQRAKIAAISERADQHSYGPEVMAEIIQDEEDTYMVAADRINADPAIDVVSLQHVFSLFGGQFGENVVRLLERLEKPVVTTIHMVYANKSEPNQLEVVDANFSFITNQVIQLSNALTVIIQPMANLLEEQYDVEPEKVKIIPHGSPAVKRQDSKKFKRKLGLGKGQILSTFGLIRPKKGLEYAIRAMPEIVATYPYAKLLILGETHPNRPSEYHQSLVQEAEDLGLLNSAVFFRNEYLSFREIIDYLLATDVFVTPYLVPEQTSSGAIAYAMACGKAIISTPFTYASEVLADKRGLFVNYQDPHSIFRAADFLFSHPDKRERMESLAYDYAQNSSFKLVAQRYLEVFEAAAVQKVATLSL